MPRYAANLSFLWPEVADPYARVAAARAAGFSRVEYLFPHTLSAQRLEQVLRDNRLELVLFDPAPGNWDAGERGLACLPGREDEFRQTIRDALALGARLGTRRLNVMAGIPPAGLSQQRALATAVHNLRAAAALAEPAGVTLLVENINPVDMPGYLVQTADLAAEVVRQVSHPAVRLQLDQYHAGMVGDDPLQALQRHAAILGHVQIADVPGRHQPGTGTQPIAAFLDALDQAGYAGCVGLEYRPEGPTEVSLAWLPPEQRR